MSFSRALTGGIGLALAAIVVLFGALFSALAESALGIPPSSLPPSILPTPLCTPPSDWQLYELQPGEQLEEILSRSRVAPAEVLAKNCLPSGEDPARRLYLPPGALERLSSDCGPPADWVLYELSPGEDVPALADRYGVSEDQLRRANCLEHSSRFADEVRLYVPATETPTQTATQRPTALPTATNTPEPETPTVTP